MRTNYRNASEAYLRTVLTLKATTFETLVCQERSLQELQRRGLQA